MVSNSTLFLRPLKSAHYFLSSCSYIPLCACQSVVKVNVHESSKLNQCTNEQLSLPFHSGTFHMLHLQYGGTSYQSELQA